MSCRRDRLDEHLPGPVHATEVVAMGASFLEFRSRGVALPWRRAHGLPRTWGPNTSVICNTALGKSTAGGYSGENLSASRLNRPLAEGVRSRRSSCRGRQVRIPQSHKFPCWLNPGNVTDPILPEFSSTTTIRTEPAFWSAATNWSKSIPSPSSLL